jgi:hypothetical protein
VRDGRGELASCGGLAYAACVIVERGTYPWTDQDRADGGSA